MNVGEQVKMKPVWLKAAILGGLWASIEIIIGSFFHNLRIPFAGTLLAANSTVLIIAFYQIWPEKGLIWRAGLIAALMKSISPSAVILGPMMGIMTEALILEFTIRLLGNNILGLSIGGSLSVASALIQKILKLILLYGMNYIELYVQVYKFIARQVNIENADPWVLILVVLGIYLLLGFLAAVLGIKIGRNKFNNKLSQNPKEIKIQSKEDIFAVNQNQKFSILLFFAHLIFIPLGLYLFGKVSILQSLVMASTLLLFTWLRYRRSMRRLKKFSFWIQLLLLTLAAGIFWNGVNAGGNLLDTRGLLIGFEMSIRAVFVVLSFSSFGVELRNPKIQSFLMKVGFEPIYNALGFSFGALPIMIEALPAPKKFILHPIHSFSGMIHHAREWMEVYGNSNK